MANAAVCLNFSQTARLGKKKPGLRILSRAVQRQKRKFDYMTSKSTSCRIITRRRRRRALKFPVAASSHIQRSKVVRGSAAPSLAISRARESRRD